MKLKVCGMKYKDNYQAVANLKPDFLGFIFFEKSERHFTDSTLTLPQNNLNKVGVFVNATINFVLEKVATFGFSYVQLHGQEPPQYILELKAKNPALKIIKVFSVKDHFNFEGLTPYEQVADYFLFDTKGKQPGGNGVTFNWSVLEHYPSATPYFLSGGIGLDNQQDIKAFMATTAAKKCVALDINSKFETAPGVKNIEALKQFKTFTNDL